MHYKPCFHCRIRQECKIKKAISTMFILHWPYLVDENTGCKTMFPSTAINFKCPLPIQDLVLGQRVSAEFDDYFMDREDYGKNNWRTIAATVMEWRNGKVKVWLDEPVTFLDRISTVVKVWPDRLTKLNEPIESLCRCGRPKSKPVNPEWLCEECDPEPLDRLIDEGWM